jgi:flagellar motor switch protein FliN/FliY
MSEQTDKQEAGAIDEQADAMAEQAVAEALGEQPAQPTAAEFDSLEDTAAGPAAEGENLDVILDIPVTLSMEIGRTHISIRNLLQLNQGSVVELDRLAGESMDVLVNGTLVAHGEVVVVNEKFGIRLTDVISPAERVNKLK